MSQWGGRSVLKLLRGAMSNQVHVTQSLQAYIIPTNDAHQSEYIAASDCRREFISGFTGSAGIAIVTQKEAALWTDGRYILQAKKELSSDWILMNNAFPNTPTEDEWLLSVLPSDSYVGFDPFLISYASYLKWAPKLEAGGLHLVAVDKNLVDVIWTNKPSCPNNPIEVLSVEYTGVSWEDKILEVRKRMKAKNVSSMVLTALDETAWLFNLRGSDIHYNPVFFSYTVVTHDAVHLFIDESKWTPAIHKAFKGSRDLKISLHPYDDISSFLSSLSSSDRTEKVWISNNSSYALVSMIPKDNRLAELNPVILMKAVKNEQEITCMKNSHVKDAVALCEFFHWLEDNLPNMEITENMASQKLEGFRELQEEYIGPSFETISAAGSNGAIIHYKPSDHSNKLIRRDELYLCDSGGQYRDGTTDVTRTVHFGTPSDYEKECYTRVLKGHILLSSAQFPVKVKGQTIDCLARKALWDVGLDYLHGTGHGVGMYLNVHEGPMGISYKENFDDPGLNKGMVLSIEPGYYEEGKFGIRIENLAVVVEADTKYTFSSRKFLTFEPLTLVPMQLKLVIPSMLTNEEIQWLNDYHNKCREVVGGLLEEQGKIDILKWLMKATMPIG